MSFSCRSVGVLCVGNVMLNCYKQRIVGCSVFMLPGRRRGSVVDVCGFEKGTKTFWVWWLASRLSFRGNTLTTSIFLWCKPCKTSGTAVDQGSSLCSWTLWLVIVCSCNDPASLQESWKFDVILGGRRVLDKLLCHKFFIHMETIGSSGNNLRYCSIYI